MQARIYTETLGKLSYTNKTNRNIQFDIATSRDDLLTPRHSRLRFRPNETQTLEIDIHAQSQKGTAEAFLYIGDED